jgi:hypothetical protein
MMIVFVLNDKLSFDKTLVFLSRSFDDFSLFHSFCVCCSHSKRGLQNFDKNYRLSVVVKRHSSQRGREKKIELHFTHIHFQKEQQQSRRTAIMIEVRTCNK